jgi:hypothetical protein
VELESDGTNLSGQEVRIVYEGRASNGGFAIDDITIYQGGCQSEFHIIRTFFFPLRQNFNVFNILSFLARPKIATPIS